MAISATTQILKMARHRPHRHGLLPPKRPRTITTYGVHPLDNTREEYTLERWQSHREAPADDPWLAPAKSEAVRALTILIAAAANHTLLVNSVGDNDLDLRGFCEDAELTEHQTEVIVLAGEGWTQRAIADWLDISQASVWRHLHSGRRSLIGRLPVLVGKVLANLNQEVYSVGGETRPEAVLTA